VIESQLLVWFLAITATPKAFATPACLWKVVHQTPFPALISDDYPQTITNPLGASVLVVDLHFALAWHPLQLHIVIGP
jgi:hypothetical protein